MSIIVGKRIADKRSELNISQNELAKILDVDRTTVSKWESGKNNLKQSTVKRLSEVLQCSPLWLMDLEDDSINMDNIEEKVRDMNLAQLNRLITYARAIREIKSKMED